MSLPRLFAVIAQDLKNHSGNSIPGFIMTYLFNQPFRLILNYRIGNFLTKRRNVLNNIIIMYYKRRQILRRNCDISYHATIGSNIRFPHPLGIVIGEGVVIADDVYIWQHVTLGSHGKRNKGFAYPTIKSGVKIFAGASIIGGITVGELAVIGANSVVTKNIRSGATVVGVPGIERTAYEA